MAKIQTQQYTMAHGSLVEIVNGERVVRTAGDQVTLDVEWVKKHDPRGVQFVSNEHFQRIHEAAVARAALAKKHVAELNRLSDEQRRELAEQTLAEEHVARKQLLAVETAIEAKKLKVAEPKTEKQAEKAVPK